MCVCVCVWEGEVNLSIIYQIIIKCLNIFDVSPAMVKMVEKLRELIADAFPLFSLLQKSVLQLQLVRPKLSMQPTNPSTEQSKWVTSPTEK